MALQTTGAFTLANVRAITSPEHLKALGLSLSLSIACTILCLLIAYPLAMILKKSGMGKKGFVVFIFILPMWMNFLLRTYAWLNLLDDGGILFNICRNLGLPTFSVVGTNAAIIMGMIYNFLPFMVLALNVFGRLQNWPRMCINAQEILAQTVRRYFLK